MSQNTTPTIPTTNLLASVPIKNTLKTFINSSTLVQNIVTEIKAISNYKTLPSGSKLIELIEHIAQVIENNTSSSTTNDDKKQMIITIFQTLFPDVNVQQIESQIEYFVYNSIIKKIPLSKKYYRSIKAFIIKKISP